MVSEIDLLLLTSIGNMQHFRPSPAVTSAPVYAHEVNGIMSDTMKNMNIMSFGPSYQQTHLAMKKDEGMFFYFLL